MGDSTSCKSDKLFQRDKGKRQHMYDPGKGGVHSVKHFFFFFFLVESFSWSHEASASHEKQLSP